MKRKVKVYYVLYSVFQIFTKNNLKVFNHYNKTLPF